MLGPGYLGQYVDGATREIADQSLRDLLVSGAQALVARLNA